MRDDASWKHVWSEQEQNILQNFSEGVASVQGAGGELEWQPEARGVWRTIEQAENVVSDGRGLFLFRGIEVHKFKVSELTRLLLAMARMFGSPAIQNTEGRSGSGYY